jgi:hypothetical protein
MMELANFVRGNDVRLAAVRGFTTEGSPVVQNYPMNSNG